MPEREHQKSFTLIGGTRNQEIADRLQIGMRVVPIQMLLRGQLQVQTSRDGVRVDDGSRAASRAVRTVRRQRNRQSIGQVAQGERNRKANS